jgi:hypothetical protein
MSQVFLFYIFGILALEELIELGGLAQTPLYHVGQETSEQLCKLSKDLMTTLKDVSDKSPKVKEPLGFLDSLIYIYTSG